ncbi:type I secretion system permease/ATPase [Rhodocyclus tenuis]|uniref:type I secretion system permease/ATPase n=1 Tax=Rhodocyclus tenuis TaxID=1066 RepID=UPI001903A053|nr:type I secretion system permease/ATPase [Rhodocyclus tenuis]MBK1681476.1 type I secretion system permease/ATPase [Rhodocyclus tenuis]
MSTPIPAEDLGGNDSPLGAGPRRQHDPLLSCLIEVARFHGRGMTPEGFLAGLPLQDGKLTPSIFRRAAARAGMATRVSRRPLAAIRDELLPAILLLKDNDACVVMGWNEERSRLRVLFSEAGQGVAEVAPEALAENYAGHCIFVRPRFRFDTRAPEIRSVVKRHWFWGALIQNLPLYRDVLLAAFLINVFATVIPFFTLNVYDRVVPNAALETLWTLAIGVLLVIGADFGLRMVRGYVLDLAGKRVDIELSALIMERVLGMQMLNRPASAGSFAANLRAFESVRDFITSTTVIAFIDLPFALIFLLLIFWLGWLLAIPLLLGMGGLVLYALMLQPKMQEMTETTYRATATRNSTLIESLVGIETIKAQCAEGVMQRKWEQSVTYLARVGADLRYLSSSVVNGSAAVQQLVTVFMVIIGVYLIADHQLSQGALIAAVMLSSRALAPFAQIAGLLTQYQNAAMALASLDKVVAQPVERPENASFVRRERIAGGIQFDRVSFSYPGEHPVEVLREASFRIAPGEHVGIIGKVGSGKSTLNRLILGLYQPTSGSIKIDGVDIQQLDPAELRKAIGYVPQDVTLFYGTLRENITIGMPYVEDHGILQAAELAGLQELVGNHPKGFDLIIGERGESLSGGQRQSVAIARALVHEPSVLLLDEPSSAMDYSTEDTLKKNLAAYARDRTMVLVTHRNSLLDLVDRLIVIDRGVIVADGPKQQVVAALASGKVGRAGA